MAFSDFSFPQVQQDLDLIFTEADLFSHIAPAPVRADFALEIADAANLALAVNTEKAKSEFIIAPLLLELRRMMGRSFGLFSGVEFNVDASRGLNGFCDFLLTRDARQFIVSAPLLAVMEAKNDNIRFGLGQCIASMYTARIFNERDTQTSGDAAAPIVVYGVVTTGGVWRFLRLSGDVLTLDIKEYLTISARFWARFARLCRAQRRTQSAKADLLFLLPWFPPLSRDGGGERGEEG